jgi:phytoene synthase
MSSRELDAAGIVDPRLRASYERCRALNAEHGKTYYLSTLLLAPYKRPAVHALYGFARYADEFVDSFEHPDPDALLRWSDAFLRDWETGRSDDPVCLATIDTARRWGIEKDLFEAFLGSMAMDITVTEYPTYADLEKYMYGSAAVIGLQMLPVLEPLPGYEAEAELCARRLGEAFQLSNFVRDVGEDLRRGRVYLPMEDLEAHGVTRTDLEIGIVTRRVRELLRFEVARTRALYREAEPGIAVLHPTSRDCIRTAFDLYGGILRAVEDADYDVLTRRVRVPLPRRLRVAVPRLLHAQRVRRAEARWRTAA